MAIECVCVEMTEPGSDLYYFHLSTTTDVLVSHPALAAGKVRLFTAFLHWRALPECRLISKDLRGYF